MTTAFSTLTLEIYYRYLPIYGANRSASDTEPSLEPSSGAPGNGALGNGAPDEMSPGTAANEAPPGTMPDAGTNGAVSGTPAVGNAAAGNTPPGAATKPLLPAAPITNPTFGPTVPKAEKPSELSPFGD